MKLRKQYNVGAYCRLSREDGDGHGTSMSIENQRTMLMDYVRSKGWNLQKIYEDDGFSGTNFDRPHFQQMLRDVDAGLIDCIVTKDLSRLGRNHLHTGLYTEEYFPARGVRFIAVNDGIDTDDEYNDIAPFKNILNEYYPRDISKKVRQVKKTAAAQGKFMGGQPSYGYAKSPQDKHVLVKDEHAARIVVRIFQEYASGSSIRMIADGLNREGLDCPRFYRYAQLGKTNPKANESNTWGHATISQMIHNPVYIGHMVQCKRQVVSFKDKRRRSIDPENWIRVENTHEPIIEKSLWDKVQVLSKTPDRIRRTKKSEISLFAGLIKCADCGSSMAYTSKARKCGDLATYRCSRYNNNGKMACSPHTIHESTLIQIVSEDIRTYAVLATHERERLSKRLLDKMQATFSVESKILLTKQKKAEGRLTKIGQTIKSLYEDKCDGTLPAAVFQSMMDEYVQEQDKLTRELENLRNQFNTARQTEQDIEEWLTRVAACLNLETIDRVVVTELIDSVTVREMPSQSGKRTIQVTIRYKFVGVLSEDGNNEKDIA